MNIVAELKCSFWKQKDRPCPIKSIHEESRKKHEELRVRIKDLEATLDGESGWFIEKNKIDKGDKNDNI